MTGFSSNKEGSEADAASAVSDLDEEAQLQEQLSTVYHELNNSLAVVSGNAQLLAEMARAKELGAAFTDPLADIEAARADISDAIGRLDALREAIEGHQASSSETA